MELLDYIVIVGVVVAISLFVYRYAYIKGAKMVLKDWKEWHYEHFGESE